MLTMAPGNATETIRKALAMGAPARHPRHGRGARGSRPADDDPRPRGGRGGGGVRPAARRHRHVRRHGRRGGRGRGGAARAAAPVRGGGRSSPIRTPACVRVQRLSAKGYDLIEAPMPAVVACTQALGAPRYPSLKGIMAARSPRDRAALLGDLGRTSLPPAAAWATKVVKAATRRRRVPPAGSSRRTATTPHARSSTSSRRGGSSDGRPSSSPSPRSRTAP